MHIGVFSRRTVVHVVSAGIAMLGVGVITTGVAGAATPQLVENSPVPAIGILPDSGIVSDVGSLADGGIIPDIGILPDSANGCAGAVCIFVTGSGLHVSDWQTTLAHEVDVQHGELPGERHAAGERGQPVRIGRHHLGLGLVGTGKLRQRKRHL